MAELALAARDSDGKAAGKKTKSRTSARSLLHAGKLENVEARWDVVR